MDVELLQVLYEIAMATGRSLDLNEMMRQALTVTLRKLNCTGGVALVYQQRGYHWEQVLQMAIPRRIADQEPYREALRAYGVRIDAPGFAGMQNRGPLTRTQDGRSCLTMPIPGAGVLLLFRGGRGFDPGLVKSLAAPVARLGDAAVACLQNREVLRTRMELETRVRRRTEQLERSHEEVQEAYAKLKAAQKQLVQTEKLASIGQLAAGVAHEINNPTGFVSTNLATMAEYLEVFRRLFDDYRRLADLVAPSADPGPPAQAGTADIGGIIAAIRRTETEEDFPAILQDAEDLVRESQDGTGRIKAIVNDLRSFARSGSGSMGSVDLAGIAEDAIRLTWNELKYNAEIHRDFTPGALAWGRADQLTQVLVNLLMNASQAMADGSGGVLTVRTLVGKSTVALEVSDTGCGIPADHLDRLFDPFFTTKEPGRGTGLGLSISHGIVEQHGGQIGVTSREGVGTTFRVILPRGQEEEIREPA